ncbi:hypothetical protein RF11_16429 [Thelohanellus kitauei]|uniref:Uncharacterized protein n=1 Tax=Thelohanellus kitauei TaxID=669202 RepID=A0A0C2N1I0_THEKT|nr:hypothetical protein RF11_16429 [Thelohanellus kitauei]
MLTERKTTEKRDQMAKIACQYSFPALKGAQELLLSLCVNLRTSSKTRCTDIGYIWNHNTSYDANDRRKRENTADNDQSCQYMKMVNLWAEIGSKNLTKWCDDCTPCRSKLELMNEGTKKKD